MMAKRKQRYRVEHTFTFNVFMEATSSEVARRRADRLTVTQAYDRMESFNIHAYKIRDAQTQALLFDEQSLHAPIPCPEATETATKECDA